MKMRIMNIEHKLRPLGEAFVHHCCFQGILLIVKLFEDVSAYDNVIYFVMLD